MKATQRQKDLLYHDPINFLYHGVGGPLEKYTRISEGNTIKNITILNLMIRKDESVLAHKGK